MQEYDQRVETSRRSRVEDVFRHTSEQIDAELMAPPVQQLQMSEPDWVMTSSENEASLGMHPGLTPRQSIHLKTEASRIFQTADKSGDGSLSHTELKKALRSDPGLKKQLNVGKWCTFFDSIDPDGDGIITQAEFCDHFLKMQSGSMESADVTLVDASNVTVPQVSPWAEPDSVGEMESPSKYVYGYTETQEDAAIPNLLNEQLLSPHDRAQLDIYTEDSSCRESDTNCCFRMFSKCFP
eukprot:TRINITY_DN49045_c0_g1_i2.p1 TRINITY_DN49045_c0_g1~~TRINITY_DN49045_c0_g1_i2.p1  ORF type:complete len:239 (+),score=58.38 TRINITY_DN49045_c0_g1_i2:462-1178(+)